MSDHPAENLERLLDLLSEQACAGLSDTDHAELQRLLVDFPGIHRDGFDLAAAALDQAVAPGATEPLPAGLHARILATAPGSPGYRLEDRGTPMVRRVTPVEIKSITANAGPKQLSNPVPAEQPEENLNLADHRSESPRRTGWLVAAAIVITAVLVWYARPKSINGGKTNGERIEMPQMAQTNDNRTSTPKTPNAESSPIDLYRDLARQDSKALKLPFNPLDPPDPAMQGVTGDVVYSSDRQQGCMRLRGLPRLNADEAVYQLWIADGRREGSPVDAGLFEVTGVATGDPSADVYIAFKPKLSIGLPVVFAITREKPGGVVVSKQTPLLVAKPGA